MQKLAEICVRRPVFASVLILSLVVVGVFSYFQLGVDRFPDVDFPVINVSTVLVGAAPEEVETEITDTIEAAVNTISGIDQLISASSEGISVVTVRFELEKDVDVAAQEVRDRVNAVLGDLPRDAEPPVIEKLDPDAAPVLTVALSGDAPIREITELADKVLRRQVESILGVGQLRIVGGRERQVNVVLDTARLAAVQVTPADVVRALQTHNVQVPGGRVEQGARDLTLRTYGRVSSPAEFGEITVVSRGGTPIRVADVARIEDSEAEVETLASVDGEPAVVLLIRKQSGTNTIEVVERVRARLAELQGQIPEGWTMRIVRDQSEYIVAAVHNVQEHLLLGSLFATLIVWVFLRRIRPTLIAAVAIPSSLIATFAAMSAHGLHPQRHHAAGADARGRHRDRRRRGGAGEHLPVHGGEEAEPPQGRRRGDPGDRPGGARHQPLADRRVPAGGLHGRHRGPVHELLRRDDGLRHRRLAAGELHADPDDGVALAEELRPGGGRVVAGEGLLPVRRARLPAPARGRWPTAGRSSS
jgi:hydrophobic/amphiphilic exporter-1 (mainly G- bacteria), HAE1 family